MQKDIIIFNLKHKDFVEILNSVVPLKNGNAAEITDKIVDVIRNSLQSGDTVSVQGFGIFDVKKKSERIIVHPSSGKKWLIPPKIVPTFKPGSVLKNKIKDIK